MFWIDETKPPEDEFGHIQRIIDNARQIDSLAYAFDRIGQRSVADELAQCARNLHESAMAIRNRFGEIAHHRFEDSQRSTSMMMAAVFGGMGLAHSDAGNEEGAEGAREIAKMLAPKDIFED